MVAVNVYQWLENRISGVHDTETVRRQKVIAYAPAAFTSVFLLVWSLIFFRNDLTQLGWIHLVFALITFVSMVLPLVSPGLFVPAVAITAVSVVGLNFLAYALTGGFVTGVWFLVWCIIIPINSYFACGGRVGTLALVLSLVAYMLAFLFDARFAAHAITIPGQIRLVYNTFALTMTTLMLFLWGVYLILQLNDARERADTLLLNILPAPVASRLKRETATIADGYNEITVLFADIVGFTEMSAGADPADVVEFLNAVFSDLDELAQRHGLEKIKTIGDAYMVAGGLPVPRPDHCERVAAFAVDMLGRLEHFRTLDGEPLRMRIGINTGPVVAGVIGRQKFIYDLWGDAVNTASRMESNGQANRIQVTTAVRDKLLGQYMFEERPPVNIKGKGMMITYFLSPLPTSESADG